MKNILKFEINKLFKNKSIYISIIILIITSFLLVYINYKGNNTIREYEYINIDTKDASLKKEINSNNKTIEYLEINNIENHDKEKNTLNNVLSLSMFISFITFLFASKILVNEFDNGTIKNILTITKNRKKVYISKYLIIIFIFFLYMLVVYLSSIIFVSLMYKINIFTLKSYIYDKEIIEILFIEKFTYKYILCAVPTLFLTLFVYNISILLLNSYASYLIGICLITFGCTLSNILFSIKLKFIKYSFLPYLDYIVLSNKTELYYLNDTYNINLSILKGNIIFIIYLVVISIITYCVFKKRDIKK